MKKIAWKMPDGSVSVTTPCGPMLFGESEEAYLDRIAALTQAKVPDLKGAVRIGNITTEEHAKMRAERAARLPPDPGPIHERLKALEAKMQR